MKSLLLCLAAAIILGACSEERIPKTKEGKEALASAGVLDTIQPSSTLQAPITYEAVDPELERKIKMLDSLYGRTPYYTRIDREYFFYVSSGEWKDPEKGKAFSNTMGIADSNGKLILPLWYSKLYNPDATVKGWIEIEAKGKRGLFNYMDYTVIAAEYDIIFPSANPSWIAIGKKNQDHYGIPFNGVATLITDLSLIPTYVKEGKNWKLSIEAKNFQFLYDSYERESSQISNGVVFAPSYLHELGYLPEVWYGVEAEDSKNTSVGIVGLETKIVENRSLSDKLFAVISDFYEEGVDGRGYQINEKHLTTVDSKNNVKGSVKVQGTFDFNYNYCEKRNGFALISNNLLETYDLHMTQDAEAKYGYMTLYSYCTISGSGEIHALESPRLFDCTKFTLLKEEHFYGCFSVPVNYSEEEPEDDEGDGNLWVSDHLDLEDLDLMWNEIFAEYGLIFKSEKWNAYFSRQPWYKGRYDSVERFLTETDKANIQFIMKMKEKMTGKEKKFTRKRKIHHSAAG